MLSPLKRIYFDSFSAGVTVLAKAIGPIHAPYSHKQIVYDDVVALRQHARLGDIILTRTQGELTTAAIPGFWKHSAIYVGEDKVIEAVTPVVHQAWLADLMMRTDHVALLRVSNINPIQAAILVQHSKTHLGKKYDLGLRIWDDEESYCSEVVYRSVNRAMGEGYLELWDRWGYPAFTPDDCWKSAFKETGPLFEIIWLRSTDLEISKAATVSEALAS